MSYWACCRRARVGAGAWTTAWPSCLRALILLCPDFLCGLSSVSSIPTVQLCGSVLLTPFPKPKSDQVTWDLGPGAFQLCDLRQAA